MSEAPRRRVDWSEFERLSLTLRDRIIASGIDYDVLIGTARSGLFPLGMLSMMLPRNPKLPKRLVGTAHCVRFKPGETESSAFPKILVFPQNDLLHAKKVLFVDGVWQSGDTQIGVLQRAALAEPHLLHSAVYWFKPKVNRYPDKTPTYYVEETSEWIQACWEDYEYVPPQIEVPTS